MLNSSRLDQIGFDDEGQLLGVNLEKLAEEGLEDESLQKMAAILIILYAEDGNDSKLLAKINAKWNAIFLGKVSDEDEDNTIAKQLEKLREKRLISGYDLITILPELSDIFIKALSSEE